MRALDFLKECRDKHDVCPTSKEGGGLGPPSNSELRRWLEKGSVLIDGARPSPRDEIELPLEELVFFPGAPRQTTVIGKETEGKKSCGFCGCGVQKRKDT